MIITFNIFALISLKRQNMSQGNFTQGKFLKHMIECLTLSLKAEIR